MRGFFVSALIWGFIVLVCAIPGHSGVVTVSWTPYEVSQGEALLVVVKPGTEFDRVEGDFDGIPLFFYEREEGGLAGIVGVDMAASPGPHPLRVQVKDGTGRVFERVFQVTVKKGDFMVQRLTLPEEMVELQGELLQRVLEENRMVKEVYITIRSEKLWNDTFIRPVEGPITGGFGVRRIINAKPRSPHSGVDISAPAGTPVASCNNGIVVLARELYLCGKTIIIDHGFGLYSIYMHLSEMLVREGQWVRCGDVIGLVGATGRVTGAHLHWGVRLLGARIDPFSLLRLFPHGE